MERKALLWGFVLIMLLADAQARLAPFVTFEPVVVEGGTFIRNPSVVAVGGRIHLYYESEGFIRYATSSDGLEWAQAECDPVLGGGFGAVYKNPYMLRDAELWMLFYENEEGIGRATSISPCGPWSLTEEPLLHSGVGNDWDAGGVHPVTVIRLDNEWRLYYQSNVRGLGLATSSDGEVWIKHDNPATADDPYANSDPVFVSDKMNGVSVSRTNNNWEMYGGFTEFGATCGGGVRGEAGVWNTIGVAYTTSADGVTWDPALATAFESTGCSTSVALRLGRPALLDLATPDEPIARGWPGGPSPLESRLYLFYSLAAYSTDSHEGIRLALSEIVPAYHYRFETNPGFTIDSVGGDPATIDGDVAQVLLPASGRGAAFPSGYDFGSKEPNLTAAEFEFGSSLEASVQLSREFAIEALVHMDTLVGCEAIAEAIGAPGEYAWSLQVCAAGFNPAGTMPGELFVAFGNEIFGSTLALDVATDYYVAMSNSDHPLSGHDVSFRLQDLGSGGIPQTSTASANFSAQPVAGTLRIGHNFDGLIDEVRYTYGRDYSVLLDYPDDDADEDGVLNRGDNCAIVANADQRDSNADGFGNVCDADLDDDCIVNSTDLGQLRKVFFSGDWDADFDGDGTVNVADLGLLKKQFFGSPGPSGLTITCD